MANTRYERHGYSQHGDYVFGWKDDALQRAMDKRCFGDVCESLTTQTPEKAAECVKSRTVEEEIDGCELCLFRFVSPVCLELKLTPFVSDRADGASWHGGYEEVMMDGNQGEWFAAVLAFLLVWVIYSKAGWSAPGTVSPSSSAP
jgi:hypothetical protein